MTGLRREGDPVEVLVGLDWMPATVVDAYQGPGGSDRLIVRVGDDFTFGTLAEHVRTPRVPADPEQPATRRPQDEPGG